MTKDELQQLRGIIKQENEVLEKRLNAKIETLETRLSTKIDTVETRLNAKNDETKKEIIETIEKESKTIAGFFHTTWEKYDNHEERIEKLEEDQLSTHKN